MLVVEPAHMPELDEHLVVPELLARPLEVVERGILEDDVGRKLEEDAAELACRTQRLERFEEAAEDLAAKLPRGTLDTSAVVDWSVVPEIGRERFELHRVAGHQAESLDVHDEALGCPLRPALDHLL